MSGAIGTAWISAATTFALTLALVTTWAGAPASTSPPVPPAAHADAAFRAPPVPGSPVRLSLSSRASADRLVLTVHLERSALYASLPARLRVRLPAGAILVSGETDVDLPTGAAVTSVLEVRVEGVPAEDIVAAITIVGEGRTAHGEARHRFGRPDPRLPDMPRLPEARVRGGGSLGTRIRVTPVPR